MLAFFPAFFTVIGSVLVFGYGYKPVNCLNYSEGIVDRAVIKGSSSSRHNRTSGFSIWLKNSLSSYPIVVFNPVKQEEIKRFIPIGAKVKIWHFNPQYSSNNVVYAEFDNGYKISLHGKMIGSIVFYTFWASMPLLIFFDYKWLVFSD